jgi:hypothetical protein
VLFRPLSLLFGIFSGIYGEKETFVLSVNNELYATPIGPIACNASTDPLNILVGKLRHTET